MKAEEEDEEESHRQYLAKLVGATGEVEISLGST